MTEKIQQIDKSLYEAGKKNGLNIKDIKFCSDILKGKTQTEAYKNNIAKPTTTNRKAIDCKASEKIRNGEIQSTLKDVLVSAKITKKSIIQEHKDILALSKEEKQLSTARQCNKDFMELEGMTTATPQFGIQIQFNKIFDTKDD